MFKSYENPLEGLPLRYLIGTDSPSGDGILECGYDSNFGIIAYCNLFDEKNQGNYGPYLHNSDTAQQYNEGQIDPKGPGWLKNLNEQFSRRRESGFQYVELDNPDAYDWSSVLSAIDLARSYQLKVIAKNPGLCQNPESYVAHPNIYGIIVEKGAGNVHSMHNLRIKAKKPTLPIWFVSFGDGRSWAMDMANQAVGLPNIGVTYSSQGEYGNSIDILIPNEL